MRTIPTSQLLISKTVRLAGRAERRGTTKRFEHVLLWVLVAGLALEESLPRLGPVSVSFTLFAVVGLYVFFWRSRSLLKVIGMPLPLSFVLLALLGLISELGRYDPMFHYVRRIAFMALGMVVVASLVRNRSAIQAGLSAFLFVAAIQAAIVGLSSGPRLYAAEASDYFSATSARIAALKDVPIEGNLNRIGFIIGMGGVLGFVVAGTLQKHKLRIGVRVLGAVCFLGVAFLASRSAILTTFGAAATLVILRRKRRAKSALVATLLIGLLWLAVPGVTRARFSFGEVSVRGREDGRTQVYRRTVANIPEVLPFGVGEARYWNEWALDVLQHRLGTHSAPLQFIVTWGLPGIVALLVVVAGVVGSLPKVRLDDPLRLGMWAIAAGVLLRWLASHTVYDKEFSVLLGIMVGAQALVWPRSREGHLLRANEHSGLKWRPKSGVAARAGRG